MQQIHRAGTAHLVFQALQRGAFFLELAVQRARRYVQQVGQCLGAVLGQGSSRMSAVPPLMRAQQLPYPLHQQAVAPILQHRQR
ncbi:hypothetical protein D3C71_1880100 [compost metagenome]